MRHVRTGSRLAVLALVAGSIGSGAIVLAFGGTAGAGPTPPACPPAVISGSTATVTCSYNGTTGADGTAQTFTVPSGVTSITIDAFGAQGGGPAGGGGGGNGGEARATFSVIPGALLTVIAAGQGGDGPLTPYATPGAGGFGGGGGGGANYDGNFPGGGGGGASSMSDGMRVLVIGGGGGGASFYGITYIAVQKRYGPLLGWHRLPPSAACRPEVRTNGHTMSWGARHPERPECHIDSGAGSGVWSVRLSALCRPSAGPARIGGPAWIDGRVCGCRPPYCQTR